MVSEIWIIFWWILDESRMDGQMQSDAYEPTMHMCMCAKNENQSQILETFGTPRKQKFLKVMDQALNMKRIAIVTKGLLETSHVSIVKL